jgi:hypothetical protein
LLALCGRAAPDSRRRWVGRSDRALPQDGSWTRTPEALAGDHREGVSNTPAGSVKPGTTSPPKVEAKLQPILLCAPVRAVAVALTAMRAAITDAAGAAPYLPTGVDYVAQLRAAEELRTPEAGSHLAAGSIDQPWRRHAPSPRLHDRGSLVPLLTLARSRHSIWSHPAGRS